MGDLTSALAQKPDLYSQLAKLWNIPRDAVKVRMFGLMYGSHQPDEVTIFGVDLEKVGGSYQIKEKKS